MTDYVTTPKVKEVPSVGLSRPPCHMKRYFYIWYKKGGTQNCQIRQTFGLSGCRLNGSSTVLRLVLELQVLPNGAL